MKRHLLILLTLVAGQAGADTYVNGYTRSNGTYVEPHMRSDANSVRYDNYSSHGNSNPYTGQTGYQRNEYTTPPAYNQSYGNSYGNTYSSPYFDNQQ